MAKIWPVPAKLSAAYVETLEDAIKSGRWVPAEKTMAIYGEDTDWGRSLGTAFRNQFQAKGWKVLAEDYFALNETDFYPVLQKFKNLDVKLIVGTSTALPAISAFIKQAREVGLILERERPRERACEVHAGAVSEVVFAYEAGGDVT